MRREKAPFGEQSKPQFSWSEGFQIVLQLRLQPNEAAGARSHSPTEMPSSLSELFGDRSLR